MKCPNCNFRTNVLDSRRPKTGGIRRTRVCPKCRTTFKTKEEIIIATISNDDNGDNHCVLNYK